MNKIHGTGLTLNSGHFPADKKNYMPQHNPNIVTVIISTASEPDHKKDTSIQVRFHILAKKSIKMPVFWDVSHHQSDDVDSKHL
jgi:hypothetical protein